MPKPGAVLGGKRGNTMIYGSVCSGIEAATAAWHPLGWRASFFSEIDKFPRHVLTHHYPSIPLHGDFTTIKENDYDAIDLLVGGTPCQAFSVAGLRKGLSDERGNLTLEFVRLAQRLRPRWLVWENVPGVLSIDGGRAFGSFLGGLAECGYGFAYRVLDAQYFGVPQRRRRVFVVGYLGDWRPAAQVLFERESLCGDITPSREAREDVAHCLAARAGSRHREDGDTFVSSTGETAHCLNAGGMGRQDFETETMIAIPIHDKATRCNGGGDSRNDDGSSNGLGIGRNGDPMPTLDTGCNHAVAFHPLQDPISSTDGTTHALGCGSTGGQASIAVAFAQNQIGEVREGDVFNTLNTNSNASGRNTPLVAIGFSEELSAHEDCAGRIQYGGQGGRHDGVMQPDMQVRRLTPIECERLQGFPDDYTKISDKTPDGSRYKALGNSMAVPVMRWIGERIHITGQYDE